MSEPIEGRITAQPGTPEYQRQFEQQALAAADASLRLGLVRIACGVFAVMFGALAVDAVVDAVLDFSVRWTGRLVYAACLASLVVELARIALVARSRYLRFLLSGIHRWHRGAETR
jgi:hypothetical protein